MRFLQLFLATLPYITCSHAFGPGIKNKVLISRTLFQYLYPRGESNPNRQNRNLKFYPLNYGGEKDCKYNKFSYLHHLSSHLKYSLCQSRAF